MNSLKQRFEQLMVALKDKLKPTSTTENKLAPSRPYNYV